jgi:hypothetical protein
MWTVSTIRSKVNSPKMLLVRSPAEPQSAPTGRHRLTDHCRRVNGLSSSNTESSVKRNKPLLKSQGRVFARYSNNKAQNLLICFPLPSTPFHCTKTSNIYKAVLWRSGVSSRCFKMKLWFQILSHNSQQFSVIILFFLY